MFTSEESRAKHRHGLKKAKGRPFLIEQVHGLASTPNFAKRLKRYYQACFCMPCLKSSELRSLGSTPNDLVASHQQAHFQTLCSTQPTLASVMHQRDPEPLEPLAAPHPKVCASSSVRDSFCLSLLGVLSSTSTKHISKETSSYPSKASMATLTSIMTCKSIIDS